jgi:hypothetical protein
MPNILLVQDISNSAQRHASLPQACDTGAAVGNLRTERSPFRGASPRHGAVHACSPAAQSDERGLLISSDTHAESLSRTQRGAVRSFILPLVSMVTLASCASFSEPVAFPLKNDLVQTVTLAVCDSHDCSKVIDRWMLKPGQVGAVNVEVNGGYGPAVVFGSAGTVVGCLPFRLSKRPPGEILARVSEVVPCGSSRGVQAAHGRDWPDPNF